MATKLFHMLADSVSVGPDDDPGSVEIDIPDVGIARSLLVRATAYLDAEDFSSGGSFQVGLRYVGGAIGGQGQAHYVGEGLVDLVEVAPEIGVRRHEFEVSPLYYDKLFFVYPAAPAGDVNLYVDAWLIL